MKKVIFGALALGLVLSACNKEEVFEPTEDSTFTQIIKEENETIQNDETIQNKEPIVIIRCTTHRNKYDCESGWGLCDCEFLPDAPWKAKIATDLNEEENKMNLSSESWIENGESVLYVDVDIHLSETDANLYGYKEIIIKAGNYSKNIDSSVDVDVMLIK